MAFFKECLSCEADDSSYFNKDQILKCSGMDEKKRYNCIIVTVHG